jgi:hypothetical protein
MKRIRPMLILGLDGYDVEWAEGFPLGYDQTDAAFYRNPSSSWVCTLSRDGFEVDIYCDGEMRAVVLADEHREAVATCGEELIEEYGVKTDDDLKMVQEWVNNPWFDLYVQGEHLDSVTHDIREAVACAKEYLEKTIINVRLIEDFMVIE